MTINSNDFSIVTAQELYDSDNLFPVDFDIAWKWLDYNQKSDAKKALLSCGFTTDIDFRINPQSDNHAGLSPQEKAVLARKENIYLTVDCFKMWAMMSGTEKGKQVRLYFLECEKIAKVKVQARKMPTTNEMARALLNEQIFRTAQSEYYGHVVSRHVDDKRYQLNPKSSQTDLMGSIYAIARLGLEQDSSLQYTHLQNTVVKQYRQTQIAREGIESIPEGLLTQTEKKQLAKLGKACNAKHLLEANPSSKESELPNKLEGITLVSNRAA